MKIKEIFNRDIENILNIYEKGLTTDSDTEFFDFFIEHNELKVAPLGFGSCSPTIYQHLGKFSPIFTRSKFKEIMEENLQNQIKTLIKFQNELESFIETHKNDILKSIRSNLDKEFLAINVVNDKIIYEILPSYEIEFEYGLVFLEDIEKDTTDEDILNELNIQVQIFIKEIDELLK